MGILFFRDNTDYESNNKIKKMLIRDQDNKSNITTKFINLTIKSNSDGTIWNNFYNKKIFVKVK